MNTKEHFGFAVIVGIVIYFILMKLNLSNLFNYTLPMYITTVVPDIIEPATDYKHRRFFHSKMVLKFLLKYTLVITLIFALIFHWFFYILFGIVGYILHLLLDLITPMGLPN